MRCAAALICLFACNSGSATPSSGSGSSHRAPRDATADADVSHMTGKQLYVTLCAPCHGLDAKGYAADRAPSLVNSTFLESASDDFLRRSILAGRPGTSMAAYTRAMGGPLNDAGVDRLVKYLRDQGPAFQDLPPVTGGDAARGAIVYAKACFTCHGDAKTRGEAVSLANPQFLAVATDPFLRHAVQYGRPGTKMESFATKLAPENIVDVVAYVRSLATRGTLPESLLPEPTGKEPLVINPGGRSPTFALRADPCPKVVGSNAPPCKEDPRYVSVDEVAKAFTAKQKLVIIDARPTPEWRRVHIAGAVSIPYHDMKRLDELAKDGTWIIAYCACPHHLSGIVVDELRKRGYAHAVVLDEGINEWHRRGLPVAAAEGVTAPPKEPVMPPGTIR